MILIFKDLDKELDVHFFLNVCFEEQLYVAESRNLTVYQNFYDGL